MLQWLRILLPVQGTQDRPLVWEDSTCHGATKPCATITEPIPGTTEAGHSKARALPQEESLQREARALQLQSSLSQLEKPAGCDEDPAEAPTYRERLDLKNGKENTAGTKNLGSFGSSLAVQWLGFHASTAEDPGSNSSWGTKILQATQCYRLHKNPPPNSHLQFLHTRALKPQLA